MSEFIGSRISLVSRSDIRYVGTLHEINSETSTVALENVTSYGTEGRKNNPDEEIAASESIYEYIVFRGSDVKDLRIEEAPAVKENKPPQVPNDPAILGSGSRPQPPPQAQAKAQAPPSRPTPQQQPPPQLAPQQQGAPPPQFPHSPYPPHFYPPPQWGRGGPGFPPMPYGAPPPGWYPPQGFPAGPMPPYGFPPGPPGPHGQPGPPGQHFQQPPPLQQQQQQQQAPKPSPIGPGAPKQPSPPSVTHTTLLMEKPIEKSVESQNISKPVVPVTAAPASVQPQAPAPVQKAPTPVAAEPTPPAEEKKAAEKPAMIPTGPAAAKNAIPTKPKNNGRVLPAMPLQSPALPKAPTQNSAPVAKPTPAALGPLTNAVLRDATQAATAAVAAAMAKLPPVSGQQASGNDAVDNLTKKVNEMRTDAIRAPRQPGAGGFAQNHRGRGRGGQRQEPRKVEVPTTDFDFETANAKFNKQDLVKEVVETPNGSAAEDVKEAKDESAPAGPSYNKSTSFFDNISSEIKDRQEGNGARPGGREWRGEEQKKNLETFGQGSVDNGFGRGGYRGRGRGRGGMRGRGYGGTMRGRGGYRGRGEGQAAAQ